MIKNHQGKKIKMRSLILILSAVLLIGCEGFAPVINDDTPRHSEEYLYSTIAELNNKMMLDKLNNRYVRVDADFGYMFYYHDFSGYPSDQWVRLSVTENSARYENLMLPRSKLDKYFNLLKGEPVTIFAKAMVCARRSAVGNTISDEIILNVLEIKRRLAKKVITFPDISDWKLINFREQDGVEVKTYQKNKKFITVYYEGGKPTSFWQSPVPKGQNMITYCDKDYDGIFETVLTNNTNCYYLGK